MNAVGPTDADGFLRFDGSFLQGREDAVEIGQQDIRGLGHLHGKAGIQHVAGGHALVHETGVGADMFRQFRQEGDDVVFGHAFDLVDLRDPLIRVGFVSPGPDGLGGVFRDDTQIGQRVAGMRLDQEPDVEPVRGFPDIGHFLAAVTRDHATVLPDD